MGTIGRVASRPASERLGHEGLAKVGASPWCWLETLALAFTPLRSPLSPGRLHVSHMGLALQRLTPSCSAFGLILCFVE